MKKITKLLILMFLATSLSVIASCGKDDDGGDDSENLTIVSVSPADGATDVASGTEISVTFNQPIKYSALNGKVTINGESVSFSKNDNKLVISGVNIQRGNTYNVVVSAGTITGYDKDISWTFSGVKLPEGKISTTCVNSSNANVQKVYQFLYDNYGKKIISGSMANVSVEQKEFELVKAATGKSPVFQTIDYIHFQYSWGKDYYTNISKFKTHWDNGGLIGASWHMMVPETESDVATQNWQYENFDANAALTDGTWQNEFFRKMISECAERLKLFKNENIVVFWRPLHEAAGHNGNYNQYGWFWWGKYGAETYKKLWKYMFDYFKAEGLDNLIWVWNSQYSQKTPVDNDWYPGDEYVDIIATDIYNSSTEDCKGIFELLSENWPNKMVTLGENGSIPNISEVFGAGGKFSYFMPWYTDKLSNLDNSDHANTAWWTDAANCENVIFLEDMKGW